MRILLDTCTFLWLVTDAPELSDSARKVFAEIENEVYLSAVSTWEIALKYSLGRLHLPVPPEQYIPDQRTRHAIDFPPLHEDATLLLKRVPRIHKDPFDRMLICQALVHDLVILTPDPQISQYTVGTMW
ncbi:MAG: type II toxin-antitoxin system VapC family toxin [Deltaproteobacteria bacterium]|nr:type II toxin-antitoxin system VapC family toxin [Deltaproteobacteria bacterium]